MAWIIAAATLTIGVPEMALADALQSQVLANIRKTDTSDIAFTQTMHFKQGSAKGHIYVTRYEPGAAAGIWRLISVDGRTPTSKEVREAAKFAKGAKIPSYASLAKWFDAPATRIAQTSASVTYRFARLPQGTVRMGDHDASGDTVADVVVVTNGPLPYVGRVRFVSDKSFRMKLIAKMDRFVLSTTYAPLADGRLFPKDDDADITGSLFGKAGNVITRVRYSAMEMRHPS